MAIAFRSISSDERAGAGTSNIVTAPAGIVDGDILIAVGSNGHGATSGMTGTGFTSVRNFDHTAGGPGGGIMWKRASSESGSYTFDYTGAGSSVNRVCWVMAISGALAAGNPINIEAIATELNTTATSQVGTSPDITTTARSLILRWMKSRTGGSAPAPNYTIAGGTATERVDENDGSSNHCVYTEDTIVDGATSTRDITITMDGSTPIRSFVGTIAIQEADPINVGNTLTNTLVASVSSPTGAIGGKASSVVLTMVTGSGSRWGSFLSTDLLEDIGKLKFETAGIMEPGGTSDTVIVPAPAGIVDGDFLLGIVQNNAFVAAGAWTPPTDWTEIVDRRHVEDTGGPNITVGWKIASSESGSYTWTSGQSREGRVGIVLRFSGAHATTPLNIQGNVNDDTANYTCPDVTTTEDGCLLVRIAFTQRSGGAGETHTGPAGYTERADQLNGNGTNSIAVYTINTNQVTGGATGTENIVPSGGSGSIRNVAMTIGIRPA